jgi:hypothetical protein
MLKAFPAACAVLVTSLLCAPALAQNAQDLPAAADQPVDQQGARQPNPPPPAQPVDHHGNQSNKPPVSQRVREYVERNPVVKKLNGDGFYPRIGGLSPGSGLAGGVGYRRNVGGVFLSASGLMSTKAYRGVDAEARYVDTRRFQMASTLKFRNNTQDDFYGLGMHTTDADRVDFGIRTTDIVTAASARIVRGLHVGAEIGYLMPSVRHGRDDNLRTIGLLYTDVTAPGLDRQPNFEHHTVFAEMDSRDAEGFPRHGGYYRAAYGIWDDRSFNEFDFRRTDLTGAQFFSVAPKSVVAMRLELIYANNKPGDRVPFYLLPYVGGGDTVRAFREFRFRDENAGVFNVEFRQKVHALAYLAAFADYGKVARDWQDINFTHARRALGVGLRAGSDDKMYLRFDAAWGDDGPRLFLKFSPAF